MQQSDPVVGEFDLIVKEVARESRHTVKEQRSHQYSGLKGAEQRCIELVDEPMKTGQGVLEGKLGNRHGTGVRRARPVVGRRWWSVGTGLQGSAVSVGVRLSSEESLQGDCAIRHSCARQSIFGAVHTQSPSGSLKR